MPKIIKMFKWSTDFNTYSYSNQMEYYVGDKLPISYVSAMSLLLGAKTQMDTIITVVSNGVTTNEREGITLENIKRHVHHGVKCQIEKAVKQFKALEVIEEDTEDIERYAQYERYQADFKSLYNIVTKDCKEMVEDCKAYEEALTN